MEGACSTHRGTRKSYKILVEKPEGKRLPETPKCIREDNIKVDLK
jgi:hypothetical protein